MFAAFVVWHPCVHVGRTRLLGALCHSALT